MAYKQHFIEWFSGKSLPSYWTGAGTGSTSMSDSVDGGLQVTTGTGAYNEYAIDFNTIRQYAHDGSVLIAVAKLSSTASAIYDVALWGTTGGFARVFYDSTTDTYFELSTYDGTTSTSTASSIAIDTAWHVHKIETGASDIKLTIDGVLQVTKTTNRPTTKMEPFVRATTRTTAAKTISVRYMECYNT